MKQTDRLCQLQELDCVNSNPEGAGDVAAAKINQTDIQKSVSATTQTKFALDDEPFKPVNGRWAQRIASHPVAAGSTDLPAAN